MTTNNENEIEVRKPCSSNTLQSSLWRRTFDFLKRSRAEPLIIANDFAVALRTVAIQQLIQDKLCLEKYKETSEYCHELSEEADSTIKEDIVSDVSQYLGFKELIVIIPVLLSALFVGSICDRFVGGKRYCLLSCTFSQFLETSFLLLNAYYFDAGPTWTIMSFFLPAFFGNGFSFFTSIYAYTATEIPKEERALRYIVIAVIRNIALSSGSFLGGFILSLPPILNSSTEQLQNYAGVFCVSGGFSLFCFCWTFIFIHPTGKHSGRKEEVNEVSIEQSGTTSQSSNGDYASNIQSTIVKVSASMSRSNSSTFFEKHPILKPVDSPNRWPYKILFDVFDLKTCFVTSWNTVSKKRSGSERVRMWLMIITINVVLFPEFGKNAVIYPLVQKLYFWDSVMYSNLTTYRALFHVVSVTLFIPIIFRIFSANDCQTAMIGVVSGVVADVFIGSIITPWGFYLHAGMSSLFGLGGTGIRAYLSKLLPGNEVSQIFSVVLMIEAVSQCFAANSFALLLELTIHSYPTFVFHFMGCIHIISLMTLVWVDLKTPYHVR